MYPCLHSSMLPCLLAFLLCTQVCFPCLHGAMLSLLALRYAFLKESLLALTNDSSVSCALPRTRCNWLVRVRVFASLGLTSFTCTQTANVCGPVCKRQGLQERSLQEEATRGQACRKEATQGKTCKGLPERKGLPEAAPGTRASLLTAFRTSRLGSVLSGLKSGRTYLGLLRRPLLRMPWRLPR